MSQRYLMGLDVGGSGGRCLLIDVETGEITTAFQPWTHRPAAHTGGWGLDLDVRRVWQVLGETAQEVLSRAKIDPKLVSGVAVTSMRYGMITLGADDDELLAVPNRDARAASEAMELARVRGDEFYQRTGHWPSPIFAGVRLQWLAHHLPYNLKQTRALLSLSDWVAYRLTGTLAAERSHASETLLFDLSTGAWADDLIASLDLPRSIFPRLVDAGSLLGSLTEEAATHLGLMAGLPVAAGGADTQSGLLGMGVVAPEQIAIIAGTTAPVQMVTTRPIIDPERRLWAGLHIVPGLWVLESNAGGMGKALDWFAHLIYPDANQPITMLSAEAAASQPGAHGIVSTLGVSVFNASQMSLPVDGLTMSHEVMGDENGTRDREHLARAVLEGLALSVRANVAQLGEVADVISPLVHLGGGMSRSTFWSQLVSDVMNTPLRVSATPEASALGAAICAGAGAGVFANLVEGAQALARVARQCTPDPEAARFYDGFFGDWNAVREARTEADLLLSSTLVEVLARKRSEESAMVKAPVFRPRILVTADMDTEALDALREMADVEYASYRDLMRLLAGDELVEALQGINVFITEVDVVDAEALNQLPDLRVVAVCRGNPVNVDVYACTALGIAVIHTPGRNADAVADLAVAYMLMLARKLPEATTFLHKPGGEAGDMGRMGMAHTQFQGRELWGKTVGLVGLGAVGRKTAQRLIPFGAQVLVHDPYVTPEQAVLSGAEKVSFDVLLAESDFVSLHAPATAETRSMIDAEALSRMKPGAYLINIARAALVDDDALLDALRSGHLGGAALDVFSVEPPGSDDPLLAVPSIIATPHIGGNTHEVAAHQGQIVLDELRRLLYRETPQHVCNPQVLMDFNWTDQRAALSADLAEQLTAGPGPAVSDLEVETKTAPATDASAVTSPGTDPGRGGLLSGLRKRLGGEKAPAPLRVKGEPTGNVRAHMGLILETFVDKVAVDEKLQDFSRGKDVTMHFFVTDLDLDFFLSFQDGTVTSALGSPPGDADVILKMQADILDGMFTGRVSGTRAALSGKLSFMGDTAKAMAFQRVQKPMSLLYTAAREEIGDPGDLTLVAEPSSGLQDAKQVTATYAAPESSLTVHRVGDVRDELLDVLKQLYARGWITGLGGNISARVAGTENEVWITPAGISKGSLRANMMVRIDLDGNLLDPGALTPSSEWRFHCAIFRTRPDIDAVVHTHAPQTTILGMTGKPFLPISTESAFIGDLPRVPFILPGTQELSDAVAGAMERGIAAIMQNHGLVVAGSSLQRAADMTEVIEVTAEKILTCHLLGQEPPVLPDDAVAKLREIGEMMV